MKMHDQRIIRSTLPFGRISAGFISDVSHHSIHSKENGNDAKGSADHAYHSGVWHDHDRIHGSCLSVKDIDLYNTCVKAYRSGDYEIVEGYVENYVPMPKGGHALESFNVGDVYFEYSENSAVCGYSQTEPYGGVIRNGQYLKIGYVYHPSYGNIIVYIEENTLLSRFSAPAK